MNRNVALVCLLLLSIVGLTIGCGGGQATRAQEITFNKLFANPAQYDGRYLTIEGFYFKGFEIIVLSEELEYSGQAEGHVVPKGRMVWIEGGIPEEVYGKLYQQQMMGPSERYGKVRVIGIFEYGAEYGHLGAYTSQLVPLEAELLPWSPPAR